ncbi:MAG: hypothetical protein US53_C0043G0003 [Candidatus Woesebacteria bacterium GW2011_GWA1_37_7]|uniref:Uncharacterized protein n=2 Tax=Candidatus Woeseibacteriota TaxID=1752722 RepID=A0A0G0H0A7_9BACT|nr:MAG: hypothetical protein US53_C0043G0003 [Candidatus Woesebacteria bacterium GW2011_GWA1_37_7]OGM19014.1 MAG: hypothetical protein A2685_00810 [Candidatus Woesebacteria bacterium RIFCSPHIGHO2_01_FULL_37_10]
MSLVEWFDTEYNRAFVKREIFNTPEGESAIFSGRLAGRADRLHRAGYKPPYDEGATGLDRKLVTIKLLAYRRGYSED